MMMRQGINARVGAAVGRMVAAVAAAALCVCAGAQEAGKGTPGTRHEEHILGVRLGMDVPTALKAVYDNAQRKPGQEKPDAMRKEGKDNKDVRVLYKGLAVGDLEIVFTDGQWVREIMLVYAQQPTINDLLLAPTGSTAAVTDRMDVLDSHLNLAKKYDDRYSIGFTDTQKSAKFWWRDEKMPEGYSRRIGFISGRLTKDGALAATTIYRKLISVKPGDEEKFLKALAAR